MTFKAIGGLWSKQYVEHFTEQIALFQRFLHNVKIPHSSEDMTNLILGCLDFSLGNMGLFVIFHNFSILDLQLAPCDK